LLVLARVLGYVRSVKHALGVEATRNLSCSRPRSPETFGVINSGGSVFERVLEGAFTLPEDGLGNLLSLIIGGVVSAHTPTIGADRFAAALISVRGCC
jgi:hypothetical protein